MKCPQSQDYLSSQAQNPPDFLEKLDDEYIISRCSQAYIKVSEKLKALGYRLSYCISLDFMKIEQILMK